ncbi:MAG: hypothetical protein AAGD09_18975 [Cyanobacteria bacterium P01_F01_bin.56]
MNITKLPWRKSVALMGMGFWASSLALLAPTAQSHRHLAYCFSIERATAMYESPSFEAKVIGDYNPGDVAYATANPIYSLWFKDFTNDGNSFVKVAGYEGTVGWVPRFEQGTNIAVMEDLQDCPNPGVNAAGFPGGSGLDRTCFYVQQPTNLYSRPDFDFAIEARYVAGDIAYATFPFTDVAVEGGNNAFILVDIYDGNQAWVPRKPEGLNTPNLVDYPPVECDRPA